MAGTTLEEKTSCGSKEIARRSHAGDPGCDHAGCRIAVNRAFIKSLVKGMVIPGALSLDLLKLVNFTICWFFSVCVALGNILTSIGSNSHFGK